MKRIYLLLFLFLFLNCKRNTISDGNDLSNAPCECEANLKNESTFFAKDIELKFAKDKRILLFKCVSMKNPFAPFINILKGKSEKEINDEIECVSEKKHSFVLAEDFDYSIEEMKYMEITKDGAQNSFLDEIQENSSAIFAFRVKGNKIISISK